MYTFINTYRARVLLQSKGVFMRNDMSQLQWCFCVPPGGNYQKKGARRGVIQGWSPGLAPSCLRSRCPVCLSHGTVPMNTASPGGRPGTLSLWFHPGTPVSTGEQVSHVISRSIVNQFKAALKTCLFTDYYFDTL